ncbi:class I SAM-dependent methyltransferase [Calothrix sp. FACHB-1219]|uniref:class I SAM-dependent methyltransferase n=1 Tax=unclassified Calothrix TaxID=2619626 RepID=UPI0016883476|nr:MULTISPECIES: class I SAM-dependent methyltransferase [unclassified Calothrix]MBD2201301.1 class I SAM-dependent methyltransferase [Calothrix sp. FACHB-168]MBD2215735.1 class I SAM-dependent methyltransferase [Calothrix sp. FACHB-1219]
MQENTTNFTELSSNIALKKVNNCPLCGTSHYDKIYVTRDRHYNIQGSFTIVRCRECSLVFIDPMPTEEGLVKLYPDDYYSYQDFFAEKKSFLKDLIKKILLFNLGTKDPTFSAPGKILDIGCGSGNFLYSIREKGWDTYGVEVSLAGAKLGREAAGLKIFNGTLLEANFSNNYFDYIRSNHSFEHLVNPNEVLQEIYRILKPDGKLMIGVPNIDSLNAKIFKKYWWYLGAPIHPCNYSVKTLLAMLKKHNFVIDKVNYNSDYSGILGSIQIFFNRNSARLSSEGIFIKNYVLVVLFYWIAKILDLFRVGDAIEITCHKKEF